jgi:hypothetical protein
MLTAGLLAGADGDSGAPTINIKKQLRQAPWRVLVEVVYDTSPDATTRAAREGSLI